MHGSTTTITVYDYDYCWSPSPRPRVRFAGERIVNISPIPSFPGCANATWPPNIVSTYALVCHCTTCPMLAWTHSSQSSALAERRRPTFRPPVPHSQPPTKTRSLLEATFGPKKLSRPPPRRWALPKSSTSMPPQELIIILISIIIFGPRNDPKLCQTRVCWKFNFEQTQVNTQGDTVLKQHTGEENTRQQDQKNV